MEYDDIFEEHVGGFGLFQVLFHLGATTLAIVPTIGAFEYAFIGATPTHWCHVPELDAFNFTRHQIAAFVSPPSSDDVSACDACLKYSRNYSDVTHDDIAAFISANDTSDVSSDLQTTKCTQWTYDTSQYVDTVVTEVHVYCMLISYHKMIKKQVVT